MLRIRFEMKSSFLPFNCALRTEKQSLKSPSSGQCMLSGQIERASKCLLPLHICSAGGAATKQQFI